MTARPTVRIASASGRLARPRSRQAPLSARVAAGLPERLWLLSIRLNRLGRHQLAHLVKQVNSVVFGNALGAGAKVGRDVYLGHHGLGTVVNDHVTVGARVVIWHGVTLGLDASRPGDDQLSHRIVVEDDVMIGAGAAVLVRAGETLVIGRGARIGAGAVVTRSVPPFSTAVGVPAKIKMDPAS